MDLGSSQDTSEVKYISLSRSNKQKLIHKSFFFITQGFLITIHKSQKFLKGYCTKNIFKFIVEMNMHGDPRMMMYGDPRMGHGDPRMMFGCRPRRWMFRHMMQNAASSEVEKSASDREEKAIKRC